MTTPQEHYARGVELLASAERSRTVEHEVRAQTDAIVAHGHFSAATAGAALWMWELATHPERVVDGGTDG